MLWLRVRSQSAAPPHATWGKQIASVALYLAAVPVAFYSPNLSLSLIAIVALMWVLPPRAEPPEAGGICDSPGREANSTGRKG